jgi:hypothetical protein
MEEFLSHAHTIASEVSAVTFGSPNEATLRHELESILERHCRELSIPWTSFQLDRALADEGRLRYADVAHGAVIIEYEAPYSFGGRRGAKLREAQEQADDYAQLIQREEGRPLSEYVLVAWDGSHVSFGRFQEGKPEWEPLAPFTVEAAHRLLLYLKENGVPLVHPQILSQLVGPESTLGSQLIPEFFQALHAALALAPEETNKTRLLFTEWQRLFGQVVGVQSERLRDMLDRQGELHGQLYSEDPAAYLFALNTYIALVAKLVAALSLSNPSQNVTSPVSTTDAKIQALESGQLFLDAGISNMLVGDFFSWYRDDTHWPAFESSIGMLIATLSNVSFDVTRKDPDTTRDLFKGLYQTFVPKALRHALGEYYTPDWLAAHALDMIGWTPSDGLLDPTCGSGTFVLEAVRRRLTRNGFQDASALLADLYGIDLNPLAVLAARASLVVFLAPYLDPHKPVHLPVFLADAINTASADGPVYRHTLLTEQGAMSFSVPKVLVEDERFYSIMFRSRELAEARYAPVDIVRIVGAEYALDHLSPAESKAWLATITTLAELCASGWDSIWAAILADRFAAAAIPPVQFIAGNPPWVKWSHLPPEYAAFIKDRCLQLGVFSQDRWVGGIESDISTVITYEALDKWLAPGGKMAFFITGTVFANESSQGFRRFHLRHRCLRAKVVAVEDFDALAPFEGVANFPTLLLLERDGVTEYPVPYRIWTPQMLNGNAVRTFASADGFRHSANLEELLAAPVPGTDAGPWLKGTGSEHHLWQKLFGPEEPHYRARKGVTTDRNGIFFVRLLDVAPDGKTCRIQNDPGAGRRPGIPRVTAVVETEHVFPLLRGRGVGQFSAAPDPDYRILLPQREMHGDAQLPETAHHTYSFLKQFKDELEQRGSYKRYQKEKPYWSLWTVGTYTFSEFKVLWKEMSGKRFSAAYVGRYEDPLLGERLVIPDHKLYFVPIDTEDEAAYLTAFLNSPMISGAISAYAAQLSLGTSVVEYLNIPAFTPSDPWHQQLAELAKAIASRGGTPTDVQGKEMDRLVAEMID